MNVSRSTETKAVFFFFFRLLRTKQGPCLGTQLVAGAAATGGRFSRGGGGAGTHVKDHEKE